MAARQSSCSNIHVRLVSVDDDQDAVGGAIQVMTDAVIWNESRTELSPVREHYGGPRQLKLRLKLRSSALAIAEELAKDIKRHFMLASCIVSEFIQRLHWLIQLVPLSIYC